MTPNWAEGVTKRAIVDCDEECGAFVQPTTFDEYKAAWKHWKSHSDVSGCSHGC